MMEGTKSKALVIIPLCRRGDRAGIERQLLAGASVDEADIEGNTPLHVAVEAPKNEIATAQCLLENNADTNATNFLGATPMHYVCLRKSNFRGMVNILFENGADINAQTLDGRTPLHFACENQVPELVEALCSLAANTNVIDSQGNSPCHMTLAKATGRDTVKRQILEHLLANGCTFETANLQGFLPLHYTASAGCLRCLQLLLDRQANVQVVTNKSQLALHLACLNNHPEIVTMLLQVSPQDVDVADAEGNTSLHLCAMVGSLQCAAQLLKLDANVHLKNAQKRTAYDLAKIKGTDLNDAHNPELVQVLMESNKSATCRQS